jgi:hypothetical protein
VATTWIAEQIRSPDQHNPLVPLALGLLSSLARFEDLLADSEAESGTPAIRSERDPILLAALGLLSLQARLQRWLDDACPAAAACPVEPASPARGEWLR